MISTSLRNTKPSADTDLRVSYSQPIFSLSSSSSNSHLYPNNLKNLNFDKENPPNFCSERATIARAQGASENENSKANSTQSKTNFSSYLGISLPSNQSRNRRSLSLNHIEKFSKNQTTHSNPKLSYHIIEKIFENLEKCNYHYHNKSLSSLTPKEKKHCELAIQKDYIRTIFSAQLDQQIPRNENLLDRSIWMTTAGPIVLLNRISKGDMLLSKAKNCNSGNNSKMTFGINLLTGTRAAVKIIKEENYEKDLFNREVEILKSLKGKEHVISIIASNIITKNGKEKGKIVFPFYQKGDLCNLLLARQIISFEQQLDLAIEFCTAVQEISDAGILHRDLKPENVLLADNGRLILTDFGLSCHANDTKARRMDCGTPEYLSPQMAANFLNPFYGHFTSQADQLWTSGVNLFAIFTGRFLIKETAKKETAQKTLKTLETLTQENVQSRLYFIENLQVRNVIRKLLQIIPNERVNLHWCINELKAIKASLSNTASNNAIINKK